MGTKPVGAAIAVGAHYIDVSGEQAFARVVYEGFGESAEERDVVLLTSFGFDYVPGDLAARLAAEGLDEPLDELVVAYATTGQGTSAGTRRTIGHVMGQPQVAWEGRLVPSRFGKTSRTCALSVGRTLRDRVGRNRAADGSAAHAGAKRPLLLRSASRCSTRRARRAAGRAVRASERPSRREPVRRTVGRATRGRWSRRRAAAAKDVARRWSGHDTYGLAALLVAQGARALRDGEARGVGALAPAEAFDVHTFAPRLAPLLEVGAVEGF